MSPSLVAPVAVSKWCSSLNMHQPRHLLEEVRVLTEQMSQQSQSNVSAEVPRVFGRSQGRQGNPNSRINQNVSSAKFCKFHAF